MRRTTTPALVLLIVFTSGIITARETTTASATTRPVAFQDGISVYFSPDGNCTWAIIDQLGKAKKSIDVQAYAMTSPSIAQAVAKAHERGLKVRVVLDKLQASSKYTSARYLDNHSVPVWIDRKHATAHNKIIIIDGATIIGGSFNYTEAAEEKNAENVTIIEGKPIIARAYVENFEKHLAHSEPYKK